MSIIDIKRISITDVRADAIVNAANEGLWAGGGVCGAIFQAAGYEKLQRACNAIGHCDTGSAVITDGFDSKAKYIIHAVGPVWRGGEQKEPELLYGAYTRSLELAAENGCRTVAFPLISAGIFGYPLKDAWRVALRACSSFLDDRRDVQLAVIFAILDPKILETGKKTLRECAPEYKIAEREDWKTKPMPERHDKFIYQRVLQKEQMETLKRGHIPLEMEDKWFWYMRGDTLYAHRSWTGCCIFRVDFHPDGKNFVTVNRDPGQYGSTDIKEDAEKLHELLSWWTQGPYDYYNEWLSEVYKDLVKAGKA